MGKGDVRAKGRPGKHYSPRRDGLGDGRVSEGERKRREKKRERSKERCYSP